jgi:hypothetical protein
MRTRGPESVGDGPVQRSNRTVIAYPKKRLLLPHLLYQSAFVRGSATSQLTT